MLKNQVVKSYKETDQLGGKLPTISGVYLVSKSSDPLSLLFKRSKGLDIINLFQLTTKKGIISTKKIRNFNVDKFCSSTFEFVMKGKLDRPAHPIHYSLISSPVSSFCIIQTQI